MMALWRVSLSVWMALLLLVFSSTLPALAAGIHSVVGVQAISGSGSASEKVDAAPTIPSDLKTGDVDGFVAGLTDAEARRLLLSDLKEAAEAREAEAARAAQAASPAPGQMGNGPITNLAMSLQRGVEAFNIRVDETRADLARLGEHGSNLLRNLTDQEGWPAVWRGIGVFLALIAVGGLIEQGVRAATRRFRGRIQALTPTTVVGRLGITAIYSAFNLLLIGVLLLGTVALSFVAYEKYDPMRAVIVLGLVAVVSVRAVAVVCRDFFTGEMAIVHLTPSTAHRLMRWIVGIAILIAFNHVAIGFFELLGFPASLTALFRVVCGTLICLLILLAIVSIRRSDDSVTDHHGAGKGIEAATVTASETHAPRQVAYGFVVRVSAGWYLFVLLFVLLAWAYGLHTTFIDRQTVSYAMIASVAVLILTPVFEAVVRGLFAIFDDDCAEDEPTGTTTDVIRQIWFVAFRLLLIFMAIMLLSHAMKGDIFNALNSPAGLAVRHAVIQIFVTFTLAYIAWLTVRGYAARRTAAETENAEEGTHGDGEFGEVAIQSRIATLLPLLKTTVAIVLVATTTMIGLSAMGVDIGPLLAGAGVVGIAIGFGAQTLVRDILSGVFFLIDDAFRLGEYIEIDSSHRGQVERITLRSMQLRHHRGPLVTLPFGELRAIVNHMRDWAIYKQEYRVPYDTDLEKVRKIIKKIGQQLLEDPEHGSKFLEPLKSQGVLRMEESALIIRTKFKCKPGEQFVLRRVVFQRIQQAFKENGIQFAVRQVTVQVPPNATPKEIEEVAGAAALAAVVADDKRSSAA